MDNSSAPDPAIGGSVDEGGKKKKREKIWYDLKGVLMHKGGSAHHGHYVAQVYDSSYVNFPSGS